MSECRECGMPVNVGDYHPYAACLMFKGCQNSKTVLDNLDAVKADGYTHAAGALERKDTEIARLREALMYCGRRMEHPRCPRCADRQQVAREALAGTESSDE